MADRDEQLQQELAALKRDYETLREDKVRAEAELRHVNEQLAELTAQAEREFGTADPEALETLLAEKRAENEKLVADYRAHLEAIRNGLKTMDTPEPDAEPER